MHQTREDGRNEVKENLPGVRKFDPPCEQTVGRWPDYNHWKVVGNAPRQYGVPTELTPDAERPLVVVPNGDRKQRYPECSIEKKYFLSACFSLIR